MKPKELSEKTGLKERTIRFYEEAGLLAPEKQWRSGRYYREYSQKDVRRLETISTLRRAGFTLEEIQALLTGETSVEALFPVYLQRIGQQEDGARRLRETAERICPTGMNPETLAEGLRRSAKYLELPPADLEPHFGRLDPETPEEKQQAIAAYQARQHRRRPKPQTAALVLLSVLCLILGAGIVGLFLHFRPQNTEPAPSGSTEGWLYYTEFDNGQYTLLRYQEQTGVTEPVYSSQERLASVTTPEKVYVSEGSRVYSMNADGSGRYLLAKNAGATGGGRLSEGSGRMAIYDGMLYLVDTTADLLYGGSALARIPLSGGEPELLDIYTGPDFCIYDGKLYADYFGDVTVLNLDNGEILEEDCGGYTGECAMGDGYIFQIHADQVYAGKHDFTWVRLEENGCVTASRLTQLPDRAVSFYAHGSRLYYTVAGVDVPDALYCFDAETGETVFITEVQEYCVSLDVFFGEQGFLVPRAVGEIYFPYA